MMNKKVSFLQKLNLDRSHILLLDSSISSKDYCKIDLSIHNQDLESLNISNPIECQQYIDNILKANNAKVAFGGYLECRNLYAQSKRFSDGTTRNVHLGMDFWCAAGTKIIVPIDGIVHSFANNDDYGNYGPTIILQHNFDTQIFYSLYGHLSLQSLQGLQIGSTFKKGDCLATLGTPDINVGYAPHLHFQIILDLQDFKGDYPGVCADKDLSFYKKNCPNPNLLLNL